MQQMNKWPIMNGISCCKIAVISDFLPEYDSRSTTCTYYVQGTASEMYVCRNYWGKKQ